MGALVSDGLENGAVVSGVGGQYNFVSQAFTLPDAHSIITLHSRRGEGRKATSNIRWRYGHETIPRHLRDIVVSEYGVAELRGKDDQDVIAAMLSIADSRFQDELMRAAKDAGKLPKHYEIPAYARDNTPERIEQALGPLREQGKLPAFPFGSDFDAAELRLIPALQEMQQAASSPFALLDLLWEGKGAASAEESACLARLGLNAGGFKNKLYAALLRGALRTARKL
jgi:hypothetical protein